MYKNQVKILDYYKNICYNEFVINNNHLQMEDDIIFTNTEDNKTTASFGLYSDDFLMKEKYNKYFASLNNLGFRYYELYVHDISETLKLTMFTFIKNNTQC